MTVELGSNPYKALQGIRVLEVASWIAAPAAAACLADMGAEVIKVEPPEGDAWRNFRVESLGFSKPFAHNYLFELDNRGKRSITLDLREESGQEALHRLTATADVFLTNLVAGRRERYGLTYARLAEQNRRLIYAAVSGYGEQGPDRDRLGFDYAAFWARSGLLNMVREPDSPPSLQRGGTGDRATSMFVLAGIMTALFERERSGLGQEVDLSLFNAGVWAMGEVLQAALIANEEQQRPPRTEVQNPLTNAYRTGDGKWLILIMAQSDPYWPKLCAALGRPGLTDDQRFAGMDARAAHRKALVALLDETFAAGTRDAWAERLDAHGIIWAPCQDVMDVLRDPQLGANDMTVPLEDPARGSYATLAAPFKLSRTPPAPGGPAPALGQHTEEVLLDAGYSWDDITALRASRALG